MTTPEPAPEDTVTRPIVWVGVEDLPVHFVNQFIGVVAPHEVFLTLGTIVPPPILGATEEERKAAAESIQFVQVKPVARIALTPARLRELIGVLNQTLSNYEKQPRMGA
jgi:hypothetical protein